MGTLTIGLANATTFIKDNIGLVAVGVGGAAIGATTGALVASKMSNSTKRKSRSSRSRASRSRDWKYASKQKHEVAYRRMRRKKGKRSHQKYYKRRKGKRRGKIKYTKKGQPYIILKSGKARFIKKR